MNRLDGTGRPPPGGVPLMGHVDAVSVGRRFVRVEGWACGFDQRPGAAPIAFTVGGRQFDGFGFSHRSDLERAGIGDGYAAFDAILPLEDGRRDVDYEFRITDSMGGACVLRCPRERVSRFRPLGFLDEVTSRSVLGWFFDPDLAWSGGEGFLGLNDDEVHEVRATSERHDLRFDLGDGRKTFGFDIAAESIAHEITRRVALRGRECALSLMLSGFAVSSVGVRVEDGKLVMASRPPAESETRRVMTSDFLAAAMAAAKAA